MTLATDNLRHATRAEALRTLQEFLPRLPAYARERNFDRVGHCEVSQLSPYLRRRIISEEEVIREVLRHCSFPVAEKFIQEVAWRTYWKGWLERSPQVWLSYLAEVERLQSVIDGAPWKERYEQALNAQTELACFNDWVEELRSTGYLHNHSRMWFASVWIFTLKLPWQLGAHFMYRNLLDGDPASNTLSWRWVGGLQTPGKVYLARADNISKYSEGRWNPRPQELAQEAIRVVDSPATGRNEGVPILPRVSSGDGLALVVSAEDLSIEQESERLSGARAVALLSPFAGERREPRIDEFLVAAMSDAEARLSEWLGPQCVVRIESEYELTAWIDSLGKIPLALVPPPVGFETPWLTAVLKQRPDTRAFVREWDELLYPLATKGFFPFWEKARGIIEERCVGSC
jgi:deoxyribodipyrimidine photo-lyase